MRIAVLGWARLSLQAAEGSGYNLSASELAAGLALSGHRVFYLGSGRRYNIVPWMYIGRTESWRGIQCFDVVNSPNLSPGLNNFRNMRREVHSPRQAKLVLRWLDRVAAQVVHIHSLEGFGLDLIGAIRKTGRPVVVTPHNYWFVCPQVDLHRTETHICIDYDGGRRCIGCVPKAPAPWLGRIARRGEQTLGAIVGKPSVKAIRHVSRAVRRRLGIKLDGPDLNGHESPKIDPEVARGFDAGPRATHSGMVDHGLPLRDEEKIPEIGPSPIDQNERFLQADHHLRVINEYGQRRVRGIESLNQASLVTPPSKFVLETLFRMGLDRGLGRSVRLGQPHFDLINRITRRSPYYDARPWDASTATRPLRLAFLGTTRNSKGLDVLARAIPLLPRDVRQRCHFIIRASGHDWPFRKRLSVYPEVSFHGAFDLLQLIGCVGEFEVGILPHVWFENSPLVMLEYLHAGRFVIASRLGGPPEWIVEPREETPGNGLLFGAGHPDQLAACIARVVTGEVVLPSPREIHAATALRSYPDHVLEFEGIYRELLGGTAGRESHGGDAAIIEPQPARAAARA